MKLIDTTMLVELSKKDIEEMITVVNFYLNSDEADKDKLNSIEGMLWELIYINGEI